jgi:hypothetical protein
MSDYFGALLRSAGALPLAAGAQVSEAGARDIVEQADVAEATAGPVRDTLPDAPPVAQSSAGQPRRWPTEPRAAHRTTSANVDTPLQATPPTPALPRTRPAVPPAALRMLGNEVHPAVRAALQWVTAADSASAGATSASANARRVEISGAEGRRAALDDPGAPTDALPSDAQLPTMLARAPGVRPAPVVERPRALDPAVELDLTPPPPNHAVRALDIAPTQGRPRRPQPQERVEVHIGTLHVSVDAPEALAPVPVPAPPRVQPQRPADRSSFARSRVPRF